MSDRFYGDVLADTTSVSVAVLLRSSTDSSAVTGVAFGSVTAYYWRQGGSPTQITPATLAAITSAYSSGGWLQSSAANMPGLYRFDIPDAAFAAGADWVNIQVRVTGSFPYDAQFRIQSSAMIPDQVLKRDMSLVTGEAARSPINTLRFLRNRVVLTPTAISVKKEDDSTEAWGGTVSTTSGAAPVTAIDPN